MATHQALSGSTDEEFLQRLARTYPERFGEAFWAFFTAHIAPHLPPRPWRSSSATDSASPSHRDSIPRPSDASSTP